jgi:hypothetical protein
MHAERERREDRAIVGELLAHARAGAPEML